MTTINDIEYNMTYYDKVYKDTTTLIKPNKLSFIDSIKNYFKSKFKKTK